jgi:hypothetical protein
MIRKRTFKQLFGLFLLFPILSPAVATEVRMDLFAAEQAP